MVKKNFAFISNFGKKKGSQMQLELSLNKFLDLDIPTPILKWGYGVFW